MSAYRFRWFRWVGLFDREFTVYLTLVGVTVGVCYAKAWSPVRRRLSRIPGSVQFDNGRFHAGVWWPFRDPADTVRIPL